MSDTLAIFRRKVLKRSWTGHQYYVELACGHTLFATTHECSVSTPKGSTARKSFICHKCREERDGPQKPEVSHGSERWFWMMAWCQKRRVAPAAKENWSAALAAWNKEQGK